MNKAFGLPKDTNVHMDLVATHLALTYHMNKHALLYDSLECPLKKLHFLIQTLQLKCSVGEQKGKFC